MSRAAGGVWGDPRLLPLLLAPTGTLLTSSPAAWGGGSWRCNGAAAGLRWVPMGLAGGRDMGRVALGIFKLDLGSRD